MVEPRTIDNLGLESSVRWAKDQEYLDRTLLKESPFVSLQTQVDVSAPSFTAEFDLLFQVTQRYKPWALFWPPTGYSDQKMRLFTFQIIPSLGTEEFQQAQMQKIREKLDSRKQARAAKKEADKTAEFAWEEEKEEEEENRESKMLLDLLEYIHELDKLLIAINSRRNQYSKG